MAFLGNNNDKKNEELNIQIKNLTQENEELKKQIEEYESVLKPKDCHFADRVKELEYETEQIGIKVRELIVEYLSGNGQKDINFQGIKAYDIKKPVLSEFALLREELKKLRIKFCVSEEYNDLSDELKAIIESMKYILESNDVFVTDDASNDGKLNPVRQQIVDKELTNTESEKGDVTEIYSDYYYVQEPQLYYETVKDADGNDKKELKEKQLERPLAKQKVKIKYYTENKIEEIEK